MHACMEKSFLHRNIHVKTMADSNLHELTSILAMVGVVFLAVSLYLFVYRWCQRHHVAGPKSWPLLGASLETLLHLHRFHDWLLDYTQKVDTVCIPMALGMTYTYITDPRNVEYVLKSNFANFPKGKAMHEIMESVLGDGIFNSDGEIWRQQRKTMSLEFTSRLLRQFSTVVFRDHTQMLANIVAQAANRKYSLDMQDLYMRLTLESICKVGFGFDLGNLSPTLPDIPFATAFDQANDIVTRRFFDPLWKMKRFLKIGSEARLKQSLQIVDDFTYRVIRARRAEIQCLKATGSQDHEAKADILSRFLLLSENPENNISDKSLRDLVLNFVIAGRDTTAATLSWFTYMLTQHEDVADRIYEELCSFHEKQSCRYSNHEDHELGDRIAEFAQLLSYDSLAHLKYLHAAITETVRLYPAVPEDSKGILEDDILPDGTKVKKGCMLMYSPYCMGRKEALWGCDAHEFRPDRWFKDGVLQQVSPFKFTAFQAGARACLGKDSAYLQMKMTAGILCRFFKFEGVPGHPVHYRSTAILSMAHGLQVMVSTRP